MKTTEGSASSQKILEAWAAGLFEGEGCVGLYKNVAHCTLTSTDEDVTRSFHEIVKVGTVYFKPRPHSHWKDQWRWVSNGYLEADVLFAMFRPYLCRRRLDKFEDVLANCTRRRRKITGRPLGDPCEIGSIGGYERHRRRGDAPCEACRDAHRLYYREYKKRRRHAA